MGEQEKGKGLRPLTPPGQKQQLQAQEAKRERARRAQQLAILGGWLMANDPAMVEMIKASLKRRQDRAAFGLPPLDAKADDLGL